MRKKNNMVQRHKLAYKSNMMHGSTAQPRETIDRRQAPPKNNILASFIVTFVPRTTSCSYATPVLPSI